MADRKKLALLRRYLHENVASGQGGVHRVHDRSNMNAQHWPLLIAKYHNSDLAALQVLLMSKVLLCGNQYFKPAASAALSKLPFDNVLQPCSAAVLTV